MCRGKAISAKVRADHAENEKDGNGRHIRMKCHALLDEQEGRLIYRDCPY